MENVVATAKSAENELVIYARITNFDGLNSASKIINQEQYEVKTEKGKVRVRKETVDGVESYTQTTKVKSQSENVASNQEYTITIDREYFDAFKSIATSCMVKVRYLFPLKKLAMVDQAEDGATTNVTHTEPDIFFEVDVFSDPDGNRYSWCKIDLELDSIIEMADKKLDDDVKLKIVAKISDLEFKPVEGFVESQATDVQKKILDYLYKDVFTVKT